MTSPSRVPALVLASEIVAWNYQGACCVFANAIRNTVPLPRAKPSHLRNITSQRWAISGTVPYENSIMAFTDEFAGVKTR